MGWGSPAWRQAQSRPRRDECIQSALLAQAHNLWLLSYLDGVLGLFAAKESEDKGGKSTRPWGRP